MTGYTFTGLFIISLAAWRCWLLLSTDVILDPLRDWVLGTTEVGGGATHYKRAKLATFLGCPWCSGFWIALAWFAAWHWWSHPNTVLVAIPLAISTVVGLTTKLDD